MRRLVVAAVCVAVAGMIGAASPVRAADAASPTGTWKWSTTNNNGQTRETTLKLKQDGDKLTGTISGRNGQETPIEDGTYKNGEVSFKVTRERNGQKFTSTYTGKVEGDTLKGKREFERNGEKQSRDFEAKRVKE
ncbi:MAG TPA: hypothetical protein VJ739_12040 [Gemmataceae bacterium]|nr:hypothetical protein [Gemmataceae bacterium]